MNHKNILKKKEDSVIGLNLKHDDSVNDKCVGCILGNTRE